MKLQSKAFLLVFTLFSSLYLKASEIKPPQFPFWDEQQVLSCKGDCANISLKVPNSRVAEHLAHLGVYLIQQILKSGAVDGVEEAPKLIQHQTLLIRLSSKASVHGDFSQKTIDSALIVVASYKNNKKLFLGLLNRNGARSFAKKFYRLHLEFLRRTSR